MKQLDTPGVDFPRPKPVVHYTPHMEQQIFLNKAALIYGVPDHYNQSRVHFASPYVITSMVVRIGMAGEFETMNTVYKPIEPNL